MSIVGEDYVLRRGDEGAARLRLLARVTWPTTKALVRQAGLVPGMRCLDVGCGIGAITLRLARRVGPEGETVGVDADERFVALARAEAERRRMTASFRSGSAYELGEENAYDLVFARFLLAHLAEPARALAEMVRAARPGGVVVVEDVDFAGHFSAPHCPAFFRYVALYQAVLRRRGGDADIGPRLFGLLQGAGLGAVRVRVVQPAHFRGPGKRIAAVTLEHIREAGQEAGLASSGEIDTVLAELGPFTDDPRTLLSLPRVFQAWGRKPT
jgi:SAM-dependent methyltransferase